MTLVELLDIVSSAFPDEYTRNYYDDQGRLVDNDKTADGFAKAMVAELIDTFDPSASSDMQLQEAHRTVMMAFMELQNVAVALEHRMTTVI